MRRILLLLSLTAAMTLVLGQRPEPVEAGTAVRLDVPGLVELSDLIVEGRVLTANPLQAENGLIETEYVLSVDRTFFGEDLGTRTVRLPGGVLPDGRGMVVPGMPKLSMNEDVLLFLSGSTSWGMRTPVGLAQGKMRVVTDLSGARTLTGSLAGVTFAGEDGHSHTNDPQDSSRRLDYAQTVAEIHAAVAARGGNPQGSSQEEAR